MPSSGNGNKVRWEVGKTEEYDEPIMEGDLSSEEEMKKALLEAEQSDDSKPESTEHEKEIKASGESEGTSSNPASNGYDPYADRDGGEPVEHDATREASREHLSDANQYQQSNNERSSSSRPTQSLDRPGVSDPGNGYNPEGIGGQSGGQTGVPDVHGGSQEQMNQQHNNSQIPEGGEQPQVPNGPASDPYDDKLGRPGENTPEIPAGPGGEDGVPRDNGVPNQGNAQGQQGADGRTPGLGNKDGLGNQPGSGLNNNDGQGGNQAGNGSGNGNNNAGGRTQGGNNTGGRPGGNGYGANSGNNGQNGDPTANARRNLGHQNRANEGNGNPTASSGTTGRSGGSSGGLNPFRNALNNVKNKLNPFSRLSSGGAGGTEKGGLDGSGEGKNSSTSSGFARVMRKALDFFKRHPYLAGIIIVFLIIFLICLESEVTDHKSNSSSSYACNYQLKGVTETGTVNLDSLQVEIVNCDATEDNYTVIETVDFEKYVIGVALAEVSWHSDYPAYFQAQIVAARGFSLKRNSGMCPSHPDDCFYGYNASTGKIRLRNCSNDQNYCDYEKDCYRKVRGEGEKAIVGAEAEGQEGAYIWKHKLDENTKNEILAAASEVRGKVLTDSSGNVVNTNYVNTDQQNWWALAQQGLTYDEILKQHYASQNASGMASATCSNYGNIDYGDYVLDSSDDEILHVPLDQFLSDHGTSLEDFANLISSNVNKAGYGTRAGVVAAAVTLIAELGNNYNVKIPYFWGGGHYDGIVDGVLGYWGSTQCHTYANNQHYNYCGFDCSGFVPWAIKNGGFNIPHMLAGNFQGLSGAQRVSLSSSSPVLQPGDLLESQHHIVLVIGVDEENHQYICAEASGNARGVLFTRRSYADSGYWGVKMDGYYETHARSVA